MLCEDKINSCNFHHPQLIINAHKDDKRMILILVSLSYLIYLSKMDKKSSQVDQLL